MPAQHARRRSKTERRRIALVALVGAAVLVAALVVSFARTPTSPRSAAAGARQASAHPAGLAAAPTTVRADSAGTATSASTTTTSSHPCYLGPGGTCYHAGEDCPQVLHAMTIYGAGGLLTCVDTQGVWRFETA